MRIKEYSKEFKSLLDCYPNEYIGYGNPNAKILFIGQEPAIDREADAVQYEREIVRNAEQWHTIITNNAGYEPVVDYNYTPLHPYANQKYQVRSNKQNGEIAGKEGTSKTWYNYQKLINKIFEAYSIDRKPMTKNDYLDFHRLSFHTDMSATTFKKHFKSEESKNSVVERIPMLSSDFFRKFSIVIAGVGHFPRDTYGDSYFAKLFGVKYLGNERSEKDLWMNVSTRNSETHPMLVIHTPQLSGSISDQYLDHIARLIVDFANKQHIDLTPLD